MKVKIAGKWHELKTGEWIFLDYITNTVKIVTVPFTGTEPK